MLNKEVEIMLYVDDVAAEKEFWQAIGCKIVSQSRIQGFETFSMRPTMDSAALFTIYDKEYIRQVSPELVDNQPSLLFESEELLQLHAKISELTEQISPLQTEPFPSFNFASPSGHYYAVKGI
ncbi:glyoxalase [Streptococcus dentasini]